jgi:putative ABC transport system permease protein
MNIAFDLQYAWRLLRKSWGYSLMCASVIALSVGLAVWTYAVAYSQVMKPLGFPGSERWYSIQLAADAASRVRPSVDAYTYQEMLKRRRVADHLGAFANQTAVLSEGQATTSLRGGLMSPRVMQSLRVKPLLGRTLLETDAQPGAAPVAVLSYDTWQQYFAGDRAIVGKTARINAAPVQIVGVMPQSFLVFDDFELWMPLQLRPLARPQDSAQTLYPLLLLHENQTPGAIVNELKPAVDAVNRDNPRLFNPGRHVAIVPASRMFTGGAGPILVMLSLMSAAVLLLGCVNISMVFFARLLERSRELALRSALGASRRRILRQCLLETALIVLAGLAAGYALAALGIQWTHHISEFGQRIMQDGRSTNLPELRAADLLIAVLAAIAVWLLSTLVPAWRVSRQDASTVLGGSGKGANIRGSNRSVGLLVGLQVIISCFVLVTCGNVVLAIENEVSKPNGINTGRVVLSTYATTLDARYADPAQRLRYWDELTASIQSKVPGAEVAYTTTPPTRPARVAASIETLQGTENKGALMLPATTVSDGYFRLMGIRLRAGRLFDSSDNRDSLPVAIVDENMAARYWPHQDAIGKRVQLNASDNHKWLTVVGVVSAVRGAPYRLDSDIGALYQPLRQVIPQQFHIVTRLPYVSASSRAAVRAAAYAVDRDLPLHNLQLLDDYREAISLEYPAMVRIFIVIALITALLAASGLFGLISRSVAQRTQEVGIRRALGATAWRATSMFLRQGAVYLSVAFAGLAGGVLATPIFSRAIPNILERTGAVTAGVVLLMAVVISTASYLPTRRAVALEPGDALRYE